MKRDFNEIILQEDVVQQPGYSKLNRRYLPDKEEEGHASLSTALNNKPPILVILPILLLFYN